MAKYEVFVVNKVDGAESLYENVHCAFRGTAGQARKYASEHNYGAGVQVYVGDGLGAYGYRKDYEAI